MGAVFISYCSQDAPAAERICEALRAVGIDVWLDRNELRGGDAWDAQIRKRIHECALFIPVISANTNARNEGYFRREWKQATRRLQDIADDVAFLIPVVIDETREADARIPEEFLGAQWTWLRGGETPPTFAQRIRHLLVADSANDHSAQSAAYAKINPGVRKASVTVGFRAVRAVDGRWRSAILAVVAIAIVGIVMFSWQSERSASSGVTLAAGEVEIGRFPASPGTSEREALTASYSDAFRRRLSEVGVANTSPAGDGRPSSELVLSGNLARESEKDVLTVRITDRNSGAMLWSIRGEPSQGAEREANLAAFALKCALKRRDPTRGPTMFSRYLYGCSHYLEGDMQAMQAAGKDVYRAAPDDPRAIGFYAVGDIAVGYGSALSKAEYDRFIGHARQLAAEALRLDPKNADALFAMGFAHDEYQYAEQEKWWRAAVDADVDGWGPGRYANFLATVGRITEAVDMELRAFQARRGLATRTAGLIAATGDLAFAQQIYDIARPLDPNEIASAEVETAVRYDKIEKAERLLTERPHVGNRRCLELVLAARRGETIDRVELSHACGGAGDSSARFLATAGDFDGAYREIEATFDAGHSRPASLHLFWPEMKPFLRDSRFWPLAARLKLVDYWLDTDQWPDFCSEPDLPFDCRTKALAALRSRPAPASG